MSIQRTNLVGCRLPVSSDEPRAIPSASDNWQLKARTRSRAFTALELLTTMIIILLLIGILLPVVGKVRRSAYEASTRNEVQEISQACDRYYDDFKAYPGPVSNSDIESQFQATAVTTPVAGNPISFIYQSSTDGSSGTPTAINNAGSSGLGGNLTFLTASQNLVLGLAGGLWMNPNVNKLEFVNGPPGSGSGPTNPVPVPNTLIGTGPQTLVVSSFVVSSGTPTANPAFKQFTSYMAITFPGSPYMMNGDGSPETGMAPYHDNGQRSFYDCVVPVFTDQFPDHMPILYVRARTGAHGILSGPATITGGSTATMVPDPTLGNAVTAHYNYDLIELLPYTLPNSSGVGVGVPLNGGGLFNIKSQHGLQAVCSSSTDDEPNYGILTGTVPLPAGWNHPIPTSLTGNGGQYFMNSSVQPTSGVNTTPPSVDIQNATGTPRQKDSFILISAGRDRTYGTGDDITNFGDVGP